MIAAAPVVRGERLRARFSRWMATDSGRVLALMCGWHLLLLALGNALDLWFTRLRNPGPGILYTFSPSWLAHTVRWDGNWYLAVLQGGYANKAASAAFYPIFPALTWLVHQASLQTLTLVASGFVVNFVASWLAVVAVLKIARCFVATPRLPWLAVAALLTAPSAYYLHSFYSEAVFFALGAWAYLFALRRNWPAMGLCLIPLTATRVTAILFVGLCFLEFWRSRGWRWRGLRSLQVMWFPAAALGFYAYAGYLTLVRGEPLAMAEAYANWPADVFDPNVPGTLWHQFMIIVRAVGGGPQPGHLITEQVVGLLALAVLVISSGYVLVRLRTNGIPLAAFGFAGFAMFTMNSNIVAVSRYVLPCVTVYIAVILWAQRGPRRTATAGGLCAASAVLQAALFIVFTSGYWVA